MRSHFYGGPDGSYPMSWMIEGSTDGIHWEELNRQANYCAFGNPNVILTFSISSSPEIRMIRIRNIGESNPASHLLEFSGLELFGTLTEKDAASGDS
jgi:hypothetical protein